MARGFAFTWRTTGCTGDRKETFRRLPWPPKAVSFLLRSLRVQSPQPGCYAFGMRIVIVAFGALWALTVGFVELAVACGCFAQPNPVQRTVQAGEQIVFAQRGQKVEMHVQVNYEGDAEDFGWLLPVPSVPDISLGSDQLFQSLLAQTQPRFQLEFIPADCQEETDEFLGGGTNGAGNGGPNFDAGGVADMGAAPPSPVVSQSDIGAFEAVVLRADDEQLMFDWLDDNEFIVPVGAGDPVVQRYVGEGRFFVALKLQANRRAGDLQPIVLEFDANGYSIPITLTQVGATPDLPVTVFVLGESRAIPRNYLHTQLNPEHINWFTGGSNYLEVVSAAVDEAEGAHSFLTEYAGETRGQVFVPGDDETRSELEAAINAADVILALNASNLPRDAKLTNILRRHVDYPATALEEGVDEDTFFGAFFQYVTIDGSQNGAFPQFDGRELVAIGERIATDVWAEIVEPAEQAEALLGDFSHLTRLFTTLSPEEMTVDPVFDASSQLPDVDNVQEATFEELCGPDGFRSQFGFLELPDGRRFFTSFQQWQAETPTAPFSTRIEALRMEGDPVVQVDNTARLTPADPNPEALARQQGFTRNGQTLGQGDGCQSTPASLLALPLFMGLALFIRRRRA